MNNILSSIKIQAAWRSYRVRNMRKYMKINKCTKCNIYYKISEMTGSELNSVIITCWNCENISRTPTATFILNDNIEDISDIEDINNPTIKIMRYPTATSLAYELSNSDDKLLHNQDEEFGGIIF